MRIKTAVRYQINDYIKPVLIYYFSIFCLTLLFGMIPLIFGGNGRFSLTGIEFITSIFMFVLGLYSFKEVFLMMLQNGISRKTMFLSRLLTMASISIIMSIMDRFIIIIGQMLSKVSDKIEITGFYDMRFKFRNINRILFNLEAIFITIFIYLALILFGYFISSLYYRMNKAVKIVVSISVPAFVFILLPVLDYTIFEGKLIKLINDVLKFIFASENPYNMLISCILFIVVCVVLSWIVIRKAVEKK